MVENKKDSQLVKFKQNYWPSKLVGIDSISPTKDKTSFLKAFLKPPPETYREISKNYKIFDKKFKWLTTDLSSPLFGRSTYEREFWNHKEPSMDFNSNYCFDNDI